MIQARFHFFPIIAALSFSMLRVSAFALDITIPNAGFEQDGIPVPHWSISNNAGSQSTFVVEDTSAHLGTKSLHISQSNADGFVVMRSERISVAEKSSFRISAWFNCKAVSASKVYFMVSQFSTEDGAKKIPNIFGPSRPLYSTGGEWEKLELVFATQEKVSQVQLSLVFSAAPINVFIDDVELTDLTDHRPRFERPTPETLMPQEDAEKILSARPRATAEIRRVGDRPRLWIDGKESFPGFYVGSAWQGTRSQIHEFADSGVHVHLIPYILGRGLYGNMGAWIARDQTDFGELEEMMWRVLRADPHGYILFYLATDPYPKWAEENPDDVVTDQNGEKAIVEMDFLRWGGKPQPTPGKGYVERYGHSYVSSQLRTDTEQVLRKFDQFIQNSLPGKAVIGYHVIGGNDGQMFAWGDFGTDHLSDYSIASRNAFREWLRVRYESESALRKAWNQPQVTFETAAIPSADRRLNSSFFLDPQSEQDIADFNRFHSEGIVDTLNGYARTLRDSHRSPLILGTYYAGPSAGVISHLATGYLMKGGLYNYLASVLAYNEIRWPGGPGKAHQAWGSLLLHDTFGLAEEDFRSWKSGVSTPVQNYHVARVETAAESNAMIRRDTGRMIAYGQGNWWYDMSGGWFSDPSIMKAVEESVGAYKLDLQDGTFPQADVAVFVDEQSSDYLGRKQAPGVRSVGLNRQFVELNSSGVPFHTYLQEDIAHPRLPDYKMYVFLCAYHLTEAEWKAIQGLRHDGKLVCFIHAPGAVSQQSLGVNTMAAAIEKVSGIHVLERGLQKSALEPVAGALPDRLDVVSYGELTIPTFSIEDPQVRVLARHKSDQTPAVALRDFGNWKSVLFGGIGIDQFFFNALAREAGAWVAAPAGNAVFANQHFLTIHALYPGEKKVQLLHPATVTDLVDGKVIADHAQTLQLTLKRGETRWFYLESQK